MYTVYKCPSSHTKKIYMCNQNLPAWQSVTLTTNLYLFILLFSFFIVVRKIIVVIIIIINIKYFINITIYFCFFFSDKNIVRYITQTNSLYFSDDHILNKKSKKSGMFQCWFFWYICPYNKFVIIGVSGDERDLKSTCTQMCRVGMINGTSSVYRD